VKHSKTAAISLAVVLMMSLLLARAHPFGDAGLYAPAPSQTPIAQNAAVPADVRAVLAAKCGDCHSNETNVPVYDAVAGRFAPASWLIERDIVLGRKAMNLDAWSSYSADQQQTFASKMVQETKAHKMPLLQYRLIHRSVRITDADVRMLAKWSHGLADIEPVAVAAPVVLSVPTVTVKTSAMQSVKSVTAPALDHVQSPAAEVAVVLDGEGDAVRGKDVFQRRCTGCHSMTENREGPKMQGIYGHAAASVPDFKYSTALKQTHIVWDDASLEQWLADPDTMVPDNDMDFRVAKPQERKDLIRYLKESAGK
jgi:cytochrome c